MKLYIKLFILILAGIISFNTQALSQQQYQNIANDVIEKLKLDTDENVKLKVRFKNRKNNKILKDISNLDQNMLGFIESKEDVTVLDGLAKVQVYRMGLSGINYKWAYVVIPDEGIFSGHPALIDVDMDGDITIAVDVKSLLLDSSFAQLPL